MSVVKKYRCRYFGENGTPIPPTCNQGEACRFVHPEDQNWPGLKPFQDTRLINKPSSKRKDTSRASFSSSDNRGAALASQSELFRCKVEGDEVPYSGHRFGSRDWDTRYERDSDSHKRRNGHLGHRDLFSNSDRRRRSYSRARSSSPRPRNTATGSMGSRKYGLDLRRSRQEISRELASNQSSSSFLRPASVEPPISKEDGTDFRAHSTRTERLVGLFKSLARLSNQVVQDTAACELQGQKLRTYTQISSELSKISMSAASSVTGTVADIMIEHEKCKNRMDESFEALEGVWDQVFDVFVGQVVQAIDTKLQNAVGVLEQHRESQSEEIKETERLRLASQSHSRDDASMAEILTQMKMKIDEQAHALKRLNRENQELKNTLKHTH